MGVNIAANRQAWITALESGEFTQGRGKLRMSKNDGEPRGIIKHCCLGVGCEVFRRETGRGVWEGNGFTAADPKGSDGTYTGLGLMPREVMDYFGLSNREQDRLVHANDTQRLNFNQIANLIDENTLELEN